MLLEMFLFFDILSLNVVIKKVVTQPSACSWAGSEQPPFGSILQQMIKQHTFLFKGTITVASIRRVFRAPTNQRTKKNPIPTD